MPGFKIKKLLLDQWPKDDPTFQIYAEKLSVLQQEFAGPDACFLIAYDENTTQKVIAFCGFRPLGPGVCETTRFVVWWDFQRMGVGRQLMAKLIQQAKVQGYSTMRVQVPASLPALVAFYQKTGFREIPPYRMATLGESVFLEKPL